MKNRKLGTSNLEIAPWVFGGNVFGWTIDQSTSFKLLDAFVDKGFNMIDTADVYAKWVPGNKGGESEVIIGKWLKKTRKRASVIIGTKVGMDMGGGNVGLSKKHILKSVDESLKRLQTDYIDLYMAHTDDPNTPLEETLETFDGLIKSGKVKAIGASNYKADRLQEALEVSETNRFAKYISLEPEYNLYDREGYEAELEPLCRKEHLGVISYYALASGFLTGKYREEADFEGSKRAGAKKYLDEKGKRILDALDQVSEKYNSQPATIAIAWLMNRESITAPIASATSIQQLEEIASAAEIELNQEAMDSLTLTYKLQEDGSANH